MGSSPATLGERHDDEEQEDRADCTAHLSLRAHRQQDRPETYACERRGDDASHDRRVRVVPICPQGDRVADEELGEHDVR